MNKISKILITAITVISIISCSNNNKTDNTAISENTSGVIRVATPGKHPLFSYPNNEGKLEGYDIDIWEEIGRRLNKKIEWTQIALDGAFGSLDTDKVDSVTQQISITPARMEKYYFAEPYFLSPYKLCVAGTNNSINSLKDMEGKKLGIPLGDSAHEFIKVLDPDGKIEVVSYSSESSATSPNNVASGKIDAYTEAVIIFDKKKESSGKDIKMVGDVIFTEVNAFPFRKDEAGKKLCDEVSKVIVEMREDGTLEKLAVKWFGYNPMEGLDAKTELEKFLNTL
ncbi:transporter substrate-binding domain-containing protein [uncultured Brachyspira sp.]|uniref:transporter substrate-binding domain-containing protein n=1 Tax=uncultured Brachyspira sp. TaxID=221953 RepID=UPI00261BCBF8|nr:transporter substrate-binding domain-containing protein [uncultured Brachyspira sp.]